jgi:nucleotide-binding universal stress UspA family protein
MPTPAPVLAAYAAPLANQIAISIESKPGTAIAINPGVSCEGSLALIRAAGGDKVYLSLLVPLDRSSFAEQAMPLALSIARRAGARLDLVKVHTLYALEEPSTGWAPFEPDRETECTQQEQLYLDATARWAATLSPVVVTTDVHNGSAVLPQTVAQSILERAQDVRADLIVMTTHGRGPLSRFGLGSVADELIRRAHQPVLLVRPGENTAGLLPEPILDNMLILLDGSALAEQVLEPALGLAHLMEAQCTLLRVVEERFASADYGASGPLEEAKEYLERIARRAEEQGVEVHTRVVVARDACTAIRAEAEAQASNLIALATHGRSGLKRLLLGSVADTLLRSVAVPMLVYCPSSKER